MTPYDYIRAARVPETLQPQEFGLWMIQRLTPMRDLPPNPEPREYPMPKALVGFDSYTLLRRITWSTMQTTGGEVVMEDSFTELSKHLPIWMRARGRVLVTGLGLGCVVRGLLANSEVEHIDVVEIDRRIIQVVGPEFFKNPRVTIHCADALKWAVAGRRFDYAWHDIWSDVDDGKPHLQMLHAKLFIKYRLVTRMQGAWAFPRQFYRIYSKRICLFGGPKHRDQRVCREVPRRSLTREQRMEAIGSERVVGI